MLKIGITGINHRHGHDEVIFEVGAGRKDWDKFVGMVVTPQPPAWNAWHVASRGSTSPSKICWRALRSRGCRPIESVVVLDLKDGEQRELGREDCAFSYRTSIFNTTERGRYIILQVNYSLKTWRGLHRVR